MIVCGSVAQKEAAQAIFQVSVFHGCGLNHLGDGLYDPFNFFIGWGPNRGDFPPMNVHLLYVWCKL